jgi:hypothetical protein
VVGNTRISFPNHHWRRGIVVIASASRPEYPRFESLEGVRLWGLYIYISMLLLNLNMHCHSVKFGNINVSKNYILQPQNKSNNMKISLHTNYCNMNKANFTRKFWCRFKPFRREPLLAEFKIYFLIKFWRRAKFSFLIKSKILLVCRRGDTALWLRNRVTRFGYFLLLGDCLILGGLLKITDVCSPIF